MDAAAGITDSGVMIAQPYHLYVERSNASRNMA
ncbi:MAG: WGR domain-containing protein, partial [Mesorhizobium sp.]